MLEQVQKIWQGPAIKVAVGNETFILGQGEPNSVITVNNMSVLREFLKNPSLAFGEAYMSGDISVEGDIRDILEGYYLSRRQLEKISSSWTLRIFRGIADTISPKKAIENVRHHYDIGNEFYRMWLDSSMTYSCAYFLNDTDTLEQAQAQKIDLICQKARLQEGNTLLDIGCGWGGLIFHAVKTYGVKATGITASKEQARFIREKAAKLGVEDSITIIEDDWRTLTGSYDRITSVGMFEHVGVAQYQEFFAKWNELLTPGGVSLLHTIGVMKDAGTDKWIDKYIFPGGYLPSFEQLAHHASEGGLTTVDVENLWQHYAKTLHHWSENFLKVRDAVVKMHDENFARMWWLYLQGSEVSFEKGGLQLWQMVMIKDKSSKWPLNRQVSVRAPQNSLDI